MSDNKLRPMTEDDLRRIETALGRPLPQAFRNVMKNFPQKLIDAAVMTDDMGNEFIDSMMISPDAQLIAARITDPWPGWPENFIVVGENGCGEKYSVDISDERCPVYESGPHNDAMAEGPDEEGYFEQIADDLVSWVKYLVSRVQ